MHECTRTPIVSPSLSLSLGPASGPANGKRQASSVKRQASSVKRQASSVWATPSPRSSVWATPSPRPAPRPPSALPPPRRHLRRRRHLRCRRPHPIRGVTRHSPGRRARGASHGRGGATGGASRSIPSVGWRLRCPSPVAPPPAPGAQEERRGEKGAHARGGAGGERRASKGGDVGRLQRACGECVVRSW